MTIKILHRATPPPDWNIGHRINWAGEVLELAEIDGNQYTWIDVPKTTNVPGKQHENS